MRCHYRAEAWARRSRTLATIARTRRAARGTLKSTIKPRFRSFKWHRRNAETTKIASVWPRIIGETYGESVHGENRLTNALRACQYKHTLHHQRNIHKEAFYSY